MTHRPLTTDPWPLQFLRIRFRTRTSFLTHVRHVDKKSAHSLLPKEAEARTLFLGALLDPSYFTLPSTQIVKE
jgi:hypothetical protein